MKAFKKDLIPNPVHHNIPLVQNMKQPLTIEIGCGVGRHPILWAGQNPDKEIIALEKSPLRFRKFNETFLELSEQGVSLKNIYPVQSNAISFISHHVPFESVKSYFLLYPNPYPKAGQSNKRWHNMPFMDYIKQTMLPGATLILATNMQFYAEEALEMMQKHWTFTCIDYQELNLKNPPKIYRTHFEEKYVLDGQVCYSMVFQKPEV